MIIGIVIVVISALTLTIKFSAIDEKNVADEMATTLKLAADK